MKRETAFFLAKARDDLADARIAAGVNLNKVAARLAYYAMFHTAEAFIYERTSRIPKTHTGVRAEFARVSHNDPKIERNFQRSLTQFYAYKETADYAVGAPLPITTTDVEKAIDEAARFLQMMDGLLGESE